MTTIHEPPARSLALSAYGVFSRAGVLHLHEDTQMADFWIKVCKDTPQKGEFAILSERLDMSIGDVFLLFFRLYSWADGQTADGFLPHMTAKRISEVSGVAEDFCVALGSEDIGWLYHVSESDGKPAGMVFKNWNRHNGMSAKKRAQDNQRQRRRRAKK